MEPLLEVKISKELQELFMDLKKSWSYLRIDLDRLNLANEELSLKKGELWEKVYAAHPEIPKDKDLEFSEALGAITESPKEEKEVNEEEKEKE